jgi:hypothetical protein
LGATSDGTIRASSTRATGRIANHRALDPLSEPDVPAIFAHVLPLTGSDFRTRLQPGAVAAVLLVRRRTHRMADAVAAAFGLTPAETRLLANLFSGHTLTETTATLGYQADVENSPRHARPS